MQGYRNLEIWQNAMKLTKLTYNLLNVLPKEEKYALADQMRRAAISIPSNIAEGHSRHNDNEFLQFLRYAQGSRSELETQFELAVELGYFSREQTLEVFTLLDNLSKGIYKLAVKIIADNKDRKQK